MQRLAQKIATSYAHMLALPILMTGVFWGGAAIIPGLRFDSGMALILFLCVASVGASAHAVKGFAAYTRWYWGLITPISIVCLFLLLQMPSMISEGLWVPVALVLSTNLVFFVIGQISHRNNKRRQAELDANTPDWKREKTS